MTEQHKLERDNAYERACEYCRNVVPANSGRAFLKYDERNGRETWRARHDDCHPDDHAPAVPADPIAAPAMAAQRSAEEELDRILAAPALQLPDAQVMLTAMQSAIAGAVKDIAAETASVFNSTVPSMVAQLLATARPLAISVGDSPPVVLDRAHKALPDVLLMVVAGASPFLVGPAGSGKTTLAEQVATALGRPFYMASRVTSEYKLVGFVDAQGKCVRTQFREAYEHGGVFLFDEVDASDADALTAFNAALAGKLADFPDGMVQRHPDFCAIAAGNTFGRGADRQYVGRNQLDAATLDRFQTYEVDYDEDLELQLAGDEVWTKHVQRVRKAIDQEKIRHVVSPRASISGAKLLAAGMDRAKVEECCIYKGMSATERTRIVARMAGGF